VVKSFCKYPVLKDATKPLKVGHFKIHLYNVTILCLFVLIQNFVTIQALVSELTPAPYPSREGKFN
jgi:hypothetical protein